MSGDRPVASTVGRLCSTRFLSETPPRSASLRARRGIQRPHRLELESPQQQQQQQQQMGADNINEEEGNVPISNSISASVQESTLRKRERIAELRRRRQESTTSGVSGGGRAGLGAGFFNAPENVLADEPQQQSPDSLLLPVPWSQALLLESPESQRFFESSDLALLLQPVEVPDIDALLEPPKRQQHAASFAKSHRNGPRPPPPPPPPLHLARPARGSRATCDFSINIPSTSLSPVLPTGWTRNGSQLQKQQRRRSRTVAPLALPLCQDTDDDDDGDDDDGDGDGDGNDARRQHKHRHVDGAVAAQLDAEIARNHELHAELMRLQLTARDLAKLALANEKISEKRKYP